MILLEVILCVGEVNFFEFNPDAILGVARRERLGILLREGVLGNRNRLFRFDGILFIS